MSLFALFTVVHVLMVVYAGPLNEMRSMITGRFRIRGATMVGGDRT
jgi:thiosulfate reductase cytochrome b subunit